MAIAFLFLEIRDDVRERYPCWNVVTDKRKVMRRLKILQKEWNGCTDKHRQ